MINDVPVFSQLRSNLLPCFCEPHASKDLQRGRSSKLPEQHKSGGGKALGQPFCCASKRDGGDCEFFIAKADAAGTWPIGDPPDGTMLGKLRHPRPRGPPV